MALTLEATLRQLRAVRVSDDGKELLLADDGAAVAPGSRVEPTYTLQLDDRLRGLVRTRPQGPPPNGKATETRPESALSPREIQARLRAGESADEVAKAAGIPINRVARYEAPIAAERVRIVDEVRRATAPGPHRANPARTLGAVVDIRLTEDGLDPALASWVARKRVDGTWLVTVDLGDHHAEWSWDGAARRVRAHDAGAQQLLNPSKAASEVLIAVAQATGVTVPETAEPPAPLAPARAVGETVTSESGSSRASSRSGFIVLPGEGVGAVAAPAPMASTAPASPSLDDVPGAGSSRPDASQARPSEAARTTWTPMGDAAAGPSEPEQAEPAPSADDAPARPKSGAKSAKRRSAVPAWDDIVFGARRS